MYGTKSALVRRRERATAAATFSNGDLRFFGEVSRSIPENSLRRAVAIYQARNQGITPALYRELRYLVKQFPNDGMTLLSFGLAAITQNQIRNAIDSWTIATEHPESEEFALEALIQIAQRSSDWNIAIRLATQLTKLTLAIPTLTHSSDKLCLTRVILRRQSVRPLRLLNWLRSIFSGTRF